MKKIILLFISFVAFSGCIFAQINPSNPQYNELKAQGLIPVPAQVIPQEPVPGIFPVDPGNQPSNGTLKIPLDGTFTLAMGPNDDESSAEIPLQFSFCLYGSSEPHVWINNNGNCSFDGPKSDFNAIGFPSNLYVMLAPFWADVDTRAGGQVWYKSEPHRFVVIWDHVGYFANHVDKTNTFELIFTDGTDPLIGVGNNVAFSYTNMEWTSGDFSGGIGGFGGTAAATVGVNKGDGIKYALVGRFDKAGNSYDGPGGANDGVGYLADNYFAFNACPETVIIPGNIPTLTEWGLIILGLALLGFGTFYIVRMKG